MGIHRENRLNFCDRISFALKMMEKDEKYSTDFSISVALGKRDFVWEISRLNLVENTTSISRASWLTTILSFAYQKKLETTFKFYDFNWFWFFIMRSTVINFFVGFDAEWQWCRMLRIMNFFFIKSNIFHLCLRQMLLL